jgi:hypothetical protein
VALIIIFVDHVPNNPFANWTLHNFAFCDAAEIFVLVSGMASYLAYGSRLDRLGFAACAKAIGRRWIKIYLAHLLLFLSISVVTLFAASRFSAPDYVRELNFNWLLKNPWHAATAALMLHYLPRFVDILPLYLVLLALAPA